MNFYSSVIFVCDIEKSKDFYTRLLKQEIEHDFGKNVSFKSGLTIWEIRPEHIINQQLDIKTKSNNFELYFESELLDDTYNELILEKVEFLHPIHEEPWGQRTIRFFDPDNHLIEVGEPLEVFIRNLKNQGLSIAQVADKTGVPTDTIQELLS